MAHMVMGLLLCQNRFSTGFPQDGAVFHRFPTGFPQEAARFRVSCFACGDTQRQDYEFEKKKKKKKRGKAEDSGLFRLLSFFWIDYKTLS